MLRLIAALLFVGNLGVLYAEAFSLVFIPENRLAVFGFSAFIAGMAWAAMEMIRWVHDA